MKNNNLLMARKRVGKTQIQVAIESSIPLATYQRYEYGLREPGIRIAIRIANALGVTDLRELFGNSDKFSANSDSVSPMD